jgi:hypothetical protein
MRRTLWAAVAGIVLLSACTPSPPAPNPSGGSSPVTPAPTSTAPGSAAPATSAPVSLPPEPTTTNTLPPPPPATAPAPKTAGPLTAEDLPVPQGWRKVVRAGGAEAGYQGNGTWVRGRDPRYAAQDAITIGCSTITRDDYPDPTAALEGSYGRRGNPDAEPGIGLLMQFSSPADARSYFSAYVEQVRACVGATGPVVTEVIDSELGLVDRRTYDGQSDWTEIAALQGDRATFIILTDPGHKINKSQAEELLDKIN